MAAAKDKGVDVDYDAAREVVYGMTYDEWKSNHQLPASDAQKQKFENTKPIHAKISGHN
jgi:hypothetical protein